MVMKDTTPSEHDYPQAYDNVVHHPLGAAFYVFRDGFIAREKPAIGIQLGEQLNSSPHVGTVISFSVGFFLAKKLKENHEVNVFLELVDTAPPSS
ncbi:hypothetical protein D9757_001852 [Collybiopsis confluens]|uniref:Uncharacterized protein n=1 Tax=Collybiopsis confluens TaxID=2823264 RepID=A0A8H5MFD6_9AGAR|nr:hypothetical protein D9757_001852 [Collybiopsis confluens]